MKKAGCNVDKMIEIRQKIHQHPEGGFKEFETHKLLKEMLLSFGIDKECIKDCAGTGMVVDIKGRGDNQILSHQKGTINVIALRTDIDGLPIPENNPHLPYKSQTDHAHMCGHDGHMATLLSAASVLAAHSDKIPKGKMVRLLF